MVQVKDEAQNHVDRCNEEFVELVSRGGVLPEHGVGSAEQYEDNLNAGGNCLLKAASFDDIDLDVIIDIDSVWTRSWVPRSVLDIRVESIMEGAAESWLASSI